MSYLLNKAHSRIIQTALRLVYPPQCLSCGQSVESAFALCGRCWRGMYFLDTSGCHKCAAPLIAGEEGGGLLCDICLYTARPWSRARAALLYKETGRRLVLGLKYADRQDIVAPASAWMAQVVADLVLENTVVVPVPLHWRRLFVRRYNQAGVLALAVAKRLNLPCLPDALRRHSHTARLDGMSTSARFACLEQAAIKARQTSMFAGRSVLLVDDVMTSGATLSAATQACLSAGADHVNVLTLARAVKDP